MGHDHGLAAGETRGKGERRRRAWNRAGCSMAQGDDVPKMLNLMVACAENRVMGP